MVSCKNDLCSLFPPIHPVLWKGNIIGTCVYQAFPNNLVVLTNILSVKKVIELNHYNADMICIIRYIYTLTHTYIYILSIKQLSPNIEEKTDFNEKEKKNLAHFPPINLLLVVGIVCTLYLLPLFF